MPLFRRPRTESSAPVTDPPRGAISVRSAEPSDAAALVALCRLRGREITEDAMVARLEQRRARTDQAVWVAVDEQGTVCGFASGVVVATLESGPIAHLTALATETHARGRGVGRGLVDAFTAWATQAGAWEAVVLSGGGEGTHKSHRGYDHLGFEPRGRVYAKTLR